MTYGAFMSYSRTASGLLAKDLQAGLQRFSKKWNQMRAIEVFRDDSNLSANPNLWGSIVAALEASRWLVLVATPEAATSKYVDDELAWWVGHRGADSVLVVHAGGVIAWDREAQRFSSDTDCIPPSLREALRIEPRWIDLAWYPDAGPHAAKDPRFVERVADLSCTIQGRDRAQLVGEDVRQHTLLRRLRTGSIVALSLLLVTSLIGGVMAILQADEASRQRDRASVRQTSALARLRADSDLQQALLLAETAHRSLGDPDSRAALYEVTNSTPQLIQFVGFDAPVVLADATPDTQVVVAGLSDGRVMTADRRTGTRVELGRFNGNLQFVGISADGRTVAASAMVKAPAGSRRAYVQEAGVWSDGVRTASLDASLVGLSPDGRTYVTSRPENADEVLGDEVIEQTGPSGRRTYRLAGLQPSWLRVHDDGAMAAVNEYGYVLRVGADGGVRRTRVPMGTWMFGGGLSEDLSKFTYTNGAQPVEVWDISRDTGDLEIDATNFGWNPVPDLSGIALDESGSQMATAADGAVFVSRVASEAQFQRTATELRGAGPAPHSLRFLGETRLLSASGNAVALWDLSRSGVLVDSLAAEIDRPCSACGPNAVAVSPSGSKAVVFDPGFLVVDFETSSVRKLVPATSLVGAFWVDDNTLLLVSAGGRAAVYGADLTFRQGLTIAGARGLPRLSMARRPDGTIVGLGDGALLTVSADLSVGRIEPVEGTLLSSDGRYLGRLRDTRLEVMSTEGLATLATVEIAAGESVTRLDTVGDRAFVVTSDEARRTVTLDTYEVATWRRTERRPLAVAYGNLTPLWESTTRANHLVNIESTDIALYDLSTGQRLVLAKVAAQVRSPRGSALAADGNTLVVASTPDNRVFRVDLAAESWSATACRRAGRAATQDDLAQQGVEPGGLVLACT